jgi:hypothetical protein
LEGDEGHLVEIIMEGGGEMVYIEFVLSVAMDL